MVFMFGIGILTILGLSIMKQKNIVVIYFLVALGLAIVAYGYDPIDGNDLHSYFNELEIMKNISWSATLERVHWKAYPVAKLYLYNCLSLSGGLLCQNFRFSVTALLTFP